MTKKLQFTELSNNGDARGFSFTAPAEALAFVGRTADVHLASTGPGAVRGNHYHLRRREAIVVLPGAVMGLPTSPHCRLYEQCAHPRCE